MTTSLSKLLRADRMRQDNDLAAKQGRDPVWSMRTIMETMGFNWDEVCTEMEEISEKALREDMAIDSMRYWAVGPGRPHIDQYIKSLVEFKGEEKPTAGKKWHVKCCDSIIQSTHRHDMVWCKCGKSAVDGGADYVRLVGDFTDFEEVDDAVAHSEG